MKQRVLKVYKVIKAEISFIILIPTVLGGIWQMFELSSISLSFLRFFSLSQLVPDGLLLLFIFISIYLSIRIGYWSFKYRPEKNKKDTNNDDVNSSTPKLSPSVFLVLISIFSYYYFIHPLVRDIIDKERIKLSELIIGIPVLIIIVGSFFNGLFGIFINIIIRNKTRLTKIVDKVESDDSILDKWVSKVMLIVPIIFILVIKFIIIDLSPYVANMRKDLLFLNEITNKELLEQKIIKSYKLKYQPKLMYFNDKYLFYKIKDSQKNDKFLIVEFSKLTEDDNLE